MRRSSQMMPGVRWDPGWLSTSGGRPGSPGRVWRVPSWQEARGNPRCTPSCASSVPPHTGCQGEGHRRQDRHGPGESRQLVFHARSPLYRDVIGAGNRAASRLHVGGRGPWLCVPASRRVCPGRTIDGRRPPPSLATLGSAPRRRYCSSVPGPGYFGGRFPGAPPPRVISPASPRGTVPWIGGAWLRRAPRPRPARSAGRRR
jgi:hypothetical protein